MNTRTGTGQSRMVLTPRSGVESRYMTSEVTSLILGGKKNISSVVQDRMVLVDDNNSLKSTATSITDGKCTETKKND